MYGTGLVDSECYLHILTLTGVLSRRPTLTARNACEALMSPSCALGLSGWPMEARTLWTSRETCSDTA